MNWHSTDKRIDYTVIEKRIDKLLRRRPHKTQELVSKTGEYMMRRIVRLNIKKYGSIFLNVGTKGSTKYKYHELFQHGYQCSAIYFLRNCNKLLYNYILKHVIKPNLDTIRKQIAIRHLAKAGTPIAVIDWLSDKLLDEIKPTAGHHMKIRRTQQ